MVLTGWAMTPIMLLALLISVCLLLFELLIPNIQTGALATRQTDSRCERYRIGISYSNFFTNGKLAIDRERVLHGHGVTRYLKWEQGCAWLGRVVNGIIQIFYVIHFFILFSRLFTSLPIFHMATGPTLSSLRQAVFFFYLVFASCRNRVLDFRLLGAYLSYSSMLDYLHGG